MNKRVAKQMINELISETNTTNVRRQFWMDKVQGYTKQIFGNSKKNIALPMFHTYYMDRTPPFKEMPDDKAHKFVNELKEMFAVYHDFIDNEIFEKRNYFSDDTNGTIITNAIALVIFIISLVWGIAYTEGERKVNIQIGAMQKEIKNLRDSLSINTQQLEKTKKEEQKANQITDSLTILK